MELSPEDAKLVTLARSSRARTGSSEGAAVRDLDGRTYAATTVALEHLRVDALPLAVAMAVSSGAKGLEAAALVAAPGSDRTVDVTAVRDLGGPDLPVYLADPAGSVDAVRRS